MVLPWMLRLLSSARARCLRVLLLVRWNGAAWAWTPLTSPSLQTPHFCCMLSLNAVMCTGNVTSQTHTEASICLPCLCGTTQHSLLSTLPFFLFPCRIFRCREFTVFTRLIYQKNTPPPALKPIMCTAFFVLVLTVVFRYNVMVLACSTLALFNNAILTVSANID